METSSVRTLTMIIGLCLATACADAQRPPASSDPGGSPEPATGEAARVDTAGDRRPNLEGIPNFEDVVAMREGDWIVLLASVEGVWVEAPGPGQAAGSVTQARQPDLAEVQQRLWNRGYVPWVVASDELPDLEPGRTVLILGPYPREDAERLASETRGLVSGAEVRSGWEDQR